MTSRPQVRAHHLEVPGGTLYYEVRGSGPLLLVIGQPMTSAPFAALADLLADDHTVVTYDPHGLGDSSVSDPTEDVTPEIEAEDLVHIVDALGADTADIFASSGGAVAALAFAVLHPDRVGTVIAHEPPLTELLPDAAHVRRAVDAVEDTYRAGGAGAGWSAFIALVTHEGPVTEAGVAPAQWSPPNATTDGDDGDDGADETPAPEKQQADDEVFFLRMLKPFTRYEPPLDTLRSGTPRVVVAVGESSGQEIARRSAEAFAEQLGTEAAVFPGDHGGFMSDPVAFAASIRQVI